MQYSRNERTTWCRHILRDSHRHDIHRHRNRTYIIYRYICTYSIINIIFQLCDGILEKKISLHSYRIGIPTKCRNT